MQKVFLFVLVALFAVLPSFAQDEVDYDSIPAESLTGVTVQFWHQHSRFRETQLQAMIAVFNNPEVVVDDFLASIAFAGDDNQRAVLTGIIDGLREIAAEYNPYGIQVIASNQGSYDDIYDKMTLGLAAGGEELPQLVVAYQNQAANYALEGGLIDITPLVESEVWGLSEEDLEDYFASFLVSDMSPLFDDALLGFPPNRSMEVMFYNIDWLNELYANGAISFEGAPQTPEQFMEAACAATANPFSGAANDSAPIGYQLSLDASRFASWTFAFGGDIFDAETGEYTLDSDAAIAAGEFLQTLFAEGCAVQVTEDFGDQTSFGAGTTLFTVASSSGLPFYGSAVNGAYEGVEGKTPFAWSVAALPHTTEEPVQNIYGASVSIPASTPEQELASWIFMKYYTDSTVQAYWAAASNYFPVRASSVDALTDYIASYPAYGAAFALLPFGKAEPNTPNYQTVRDDIISPTMAAFTQDTSVDVVEALVEANESANASLAEMMGE